MPLSSAQRADLYREAILQLRTFTIHNLPAHFVGLCAAIENVVSGPERSPRTADRYAEDLLDEIAASLGEDGAAWRHGMSTTLPRANSIAGRDARIQLLRMLAEFHEELAAREGG